MTIDPKITKAVAEIEPRIARALSEFARQHADLLKLDVHERTLCHHFALCLAAEFPGWEVDCEYNRMLDKVKKLAWCGNEKLLNVMPDIVVHHRHEIGPEHDLLAIEVKKWDSAPSNKADDIKKLQAFKLPPFDYRHALYVELNTGERYTLPPHLRWI